jgi:methionine salvage enolase-phosphatase E1
VPRIKFEELSFEKLIGEGNYGDVHKGKYFDVDVGAKKRSTTHTYIYAYIHIPYAMRLFLSVL